MPACAGRGLISAFRYGMISPGKSRIVLDVTEPVTVDKSFVVPPTDKQPARLVIDVVPTTRQAFLDTNRAYRETQAIEASAKRDRELVAAAEAAAAGRLVDRPRSRPWRHRHRSARLRRHCREGQ